MPELVQPLIVVVLEMLARSAEPAGAAGTMFDANGRAADMVRILAEQSYGALVCGL